MQDKGEKQHLLIYKVLYTGILVLFYMMGRSIPLYGIDTSVYKDSVIDIENILIQTVSGDVNRMSLLALGMSPYMIGSMASQFAMALKSSDSRQNTSPRKINVITLLLTVFIAVFQAGMQVQGMTFVCSGEALGLVKALNVLEMTTGAILILWLSVRNKKYGIGGPTIFIFINILDGIMSVLVKQSIRDMILPLILSLVIIYITIVMENAELRVAVQRISIHNIYADKDYLAIKMNPIGIMPMMFASAFYMLPLFAVNGLYYLFPQNSSLIWLNENMALSKPFGIGVYILILFILTIAFSYVFVNPKEITEQFLKSGDSLVNIHAGRDTRRYLNRKLLKMSLFSAFVMSICAGLPMVLKLYGELNDAQAMLPSSIMMLTGIWCNLYQEWQAIKNLDSYRVFLP